MKSSLPSVLWLALPLSLAAACSNAAPADPSSAGAGGSGAPGSGAPGSGAPGSGAPGGGAPGGGAAGATSAGAGDTAGLGGAVAGAAATGGSGAGAGNGNAGTSGTAGTAGASDGDIPPTHPLLVTATKALHSHSFLPSDADPTVSANTFSGTNMEVAQVDARAAKMVGKLVVSLGGQGSTGAYTGGAAAFAVKRGYHVFAVAYMANFDILLNDANYYGDARLEEFDGQDHTSKYATRDGKPSEKLGLQPADGVEQRVRLGLSYLAKTYANEDWSYYLTADGSVRWSDVIFAGVSHGASSAVRFAMLVRASRAIAFSGPRDNTCASVACTEPGAVIATWFSETPKTPRDRLFGITGAIDSQHTQHLVAFERLGFSGSLVDVDAQATPYASSHRLSSTSADHGAFLRRRQVPRRLQLPARRAAGEPRRRALSRIGRAAVDMRPSSNFLDD